VSTKEELTKEVAKEEVAKDQPNAIGEESSEAPA
jgi:hypothetical protein